VQLEPSRDLEYPVDRSEPEALERVRNWFAAADAKIEVWQLRQVLQMSEVGGEPALRALIMRVMEKDRRTESDRDKLDFLLAQYFFHCAPAKLHQGEPSLEEVAEVLEPVIGEASTEPPAWLSPLNGIIAEMGKCRSLTDLLQGGVLARARKLKTDAGDMFFGSGALLTFTRFNFLVRGTFVRLIHNDLHAIRFTLHALEERGQKTFDCTAAGMGKGETSDALRQFLHEWKTLFRAAYSSGQSFQQLIKLRELLEAALAAPVPQVVAPAPPPAPAPPVAKAAPAPPAAKAPAAVAPAKPAAPAPAPKPAPVAAAPVPQPKKEEKKAPAAAPVPQPVAAPPKAAPKPEAVKPAATPPVAPAAKPAAPPTPTPVAVQQAVASAYKATPKIETAKPAAKPAMAVAAKPAAPAAPADVDACLEQIGEQLLKDAAKKGTVVVGVTVAGHKLMLSSWEVTAFVEGGDEVADAARALLSRAAEEHKQGNDSGLAAALAAGHAEAAAIQAQIAQAKEKKNIDAAVNLAASARRLIGLMEEIEKGAKPPQGSKQ
jgi:hypothetical protein